MKKIENFQELIDALTAFGFADGVHHQAGTEAYAHYDLHKWEQEDKGTFASAGKIHIIQVDGSPNTVVQFHFGENYKWQTFNSTPEQVIELLILLYHMNRKYLNA